MQLPYNIYLFIYSHRGTKFILPFECIAGLLIGRNDSILQKRNGVECCLCCLLLRTYRIIRILYWKVKADLNSITNDLHC